MSDLVIKSEYSLKLELLDDPYPPCAMLALRVKYDSISPEACDFCAPWNRLFLVAQDAPAQRKEGNVLICRDTLPGLSRAKIMQVLIHQEKVSGKRYGSSRNIPPEG